MNSAWWGQSFVSELRRISERAENKLKVRRDSIKAGTATDSDLPVRTNVERESSHESGMNGTASEPEGLNGTVNEHEGMNGTVKEQNGSPVQPAV